jgi:hypothetical protein
MSFDQGLSDIVTYNECPHRLTAAPGCASFTVSVIRFWQFDKFFSVQKFFDKWRTLAENFGVLVGGQGRVQRPESKGAETWV